MKKKQKVIFGEQNENMGELEKKLIIKREKVTIDLVGQEYYLAPKAKFHFLKKF